MKIILRLSLLLLTSKCYSKRLYPTSDSYEESYENYQRESRSKVSESDRFPTLRNSLPHQVHADLRKSSSEIYNGALETLSPSKTQKKTKNSGSAQEKNVINDIDRDVDEKQKVYCGDPKDREDILRKYLQEGLPPIPDGKNCQKHVIIVGAGMSGLTAGKLLKDAGHEVTILESNDRVGGRVQTYRDLEDNWQNELGPMRIPKMHGLTRELISQFGLQIEPFENDPIAYFVENKRIGYQSYAKSNAQKQVMKYIFQKFNVDKSKEMVSASKLIAEALSEPLKDFNQLSWKDLLKKYDKFSMKHWLAQYANVSEEAIALAGIFYNIEPWIDNGLMEILIDECIFGSDGGFDYIPGGFDQLPQGFLKYLSKNIHYHSKVTHIFQTRKNHVYVRSVCRGISCEKNFLFKGNFAIVTPTAPVTNTIEFDPPLSTKKNLAIRTASYSPATKILLAFETPFWEREHKKAKGGATLTDLRVRQIYYPQKHMNPNSTLHVLVASYTWGRDANRYDGMTDRDAIHECLEDIAKIHKRSLEYIRSQYRDGFVKRWALDENTLGAFAMFPPYQFIELEDVLKQREGLISFAGEHTSTPHGWMNTAIKSGIRAALEIHQSACFS